MSICTTCGFVTYPDKIRSKAELIEYYKHDYRPAPNFQNLVTGERKLQYHIAFLADTFDQWKKEGKENLVVTEIGSAFGMFLNWFRGIFPKAEMEGVELTRSYVRNAWHLYKIKSRDDFDDSKKYDFIASYKCLEHMAEPDVELKRYLAALKDDGVLYLGVPIWWEQAKNFGASGFDLEYYYSTNHINVWSRSHVEGLIDAAGGEIVKENCTFYDTVYLIKRKSEAKEKVDPIYYQDAELIRGDMYRLQQASEYFQLGQYSKAIEAWPNYPSAWTAYYEFNRKQFHQNGFDWIYENVIEKAIAACPDDAEIHCLAADICRRYTEYELALDHLDQANRLRPNQGRDFPAHGKECQDAEGHDKIPRRIKKDRDRDQGSWDWLCAGRFELDMP
jgi:SAM-dependent methyltransferase